MALNLSCLGVFQWGRTVYFRRSGRNDNIRGGLGPIGSIFAIIQIPLVWVGGVSSTQLEMVVAVLFYASALVLFFWAIRSHGANRPGIAFSSETPEVLITRGAYQISRHPFYLSYMLFWAGTAMIAPMLSGVVIFLIMATLYSRAASQEEKGILSSPLGSYYAKYQMCVGRFFRWPRRKKMD